MSYQQFFKKAAQAKRESSSKVSGDRKFTTKHVGTGKPTVSEEDLLRKALRVPQKRKKAPFPWKAFVGLALTTAGVGVYLVMPDYVENLASRIEVNAIGSAIAADAKPAENSKAGGTKSEKAAAGGEVGNPDVGLQPKSVVPQDLSHFEKLKQRKDELDMREKELAELEEELQKQKVELDKRIVQLEEMRNQIAQILKDRVEVDQEKVTKLVDLYSNMKPKQAADVIGSINEDLAVEVLAKMKKKNAAEIMNLLSPEKARVLSEKYTGYRRQMNEPKG